MGSIEDALLVEIWRALVLRSLAALLGRDIPGKSSAPVVSNFAVGVAVWSTDTTDLIGKTRSVAEGLKGREGELMFCVLCFHGVERDS